jgi:hypothetical protein
MRLTDQVEVHSLAAGIEFLFGYEVAVLISRQVSMFVLFLGDCCSDNGLERSIASLAPTSVWRFYSPLRIRDWRYASCAGGAEALLSGSGV